MQIGMFADMYMPHISGVTNQIRLFKRELERRGHAVYVFTFGDRHYPDDEPNIIRSPAIPFFRTGWQVPTSVSAEARSIMRKLDVAHAHHPFVSERVAAMCKPNAAVVFTNHTRYDLYGHQYAGWLPRGLSDKLVRNEMHRVCSEVDAALAPSSSIAHWLSEWGGTSEAIVFRNAIDVRHFAEPTEKLNRAAFGLSDKDVVVAYMGRIANEKNIALVIDSFVRAHARESRIAFLAIGDGPARAQAQQRIEAAGLSKRAAFVGAVPFEECPNYLALADIFVTASVTETYGLVVVEAAASGLPVVAVRAPGVDEIVVDGQSGFLTRNDARSHADAVARLATNVVLRRQMAEQARKSAEKFDIVPAVEQLESLYEALHRQRVTQLSETH